MEQVFLCWEFEVDNFLHPEVSLHLMTCWSKLLVGVLHLRVQT